MSTPAPTATDQSLIVRLRAGDEFAASEMYERYAKRVFGLVEKQMSDRLRVQVGSEDVVQSVFKSLFRGINSGDYNAPAGGTLWHLMAIVAIHKVRRSARRQAALKRDAALTQPLEDFDFAADCAPEAFELAIREAIEGLKETEQDVVLLRVQGFSVEEIATRLERSRRSIERTLKSVREKMLLWLDDAPSENF